MSVININKIAFFPGSFDPITIGHYDIVLRALKLFDKVIIGVGENVSKTSFFPLKDRLTFIEKAFLKEERVEIISFKGLTADLCHKNNISFIIRGLRNSIDFTYERNIATINKNLNKKLETISFFTSSKYADISSNIIKDIYKNGGDVSSFLPTGVNLTE